MEKEQKRIALFVDFDNIYLGLRETSRDAAEAFATKPQTWLRWIEQGMRMDPEAGSTGPAENRVLIRRCYLNPDSFSKYRVYFTRSGFSVVDCPPLTSRGKNSSDIVMVMDILDALRHETRFDEFVLMSADADFTPVLQRLRDHDRRTAVLVSGQAAPAYRAACDRLITEDTFIELALEIAPGPEPLRLSASTSALTSPVSVRDLGLLTAMAQRIYEEASSSGTLPGSEIPRILREFKQFTPSSNWLGYYSLRALTEAILAQRIDLRITDDDPWSVAVQVHQAAAPPADGDRQALIAPEQLDRDWDALRERVVQVVSRMVAESPAPIVMARAAQAALQQMGPILTETHWLGKSTFKNLLLASSELPFEVAASPLPGFVYDPARHRPPSEKTAGDGLGELGGDMASFIRRINQLTDAPKLTPHQYSVLYRVIANELGRAPYNVMGTGKAVRDQCVERGVPIARQSVTTVLRGLGYAGFDFGKAMHRPEELATAYRGSLLNQLRRAQVTLGEDELRMLDAWLLGEFQTEPSPQESTKAEPDYAAWAEALLAQDHVPVLTAGQENDGVWGQVTFSGAELHRNELPAVEDSGPSTIVSDQIAVEASRDGSGAAPMRGQEPAEQRHDGRDHVQVTECAAETLRPFEQDPNGATVIANSDIVGGKARETSWAPKIVPNVDKGAREPLPLDADADAERKEQQHQHPANVPSLPIDARPEPDTLHRDASSPEPPHAAGPVGEVDLATDTAAAPAPESTTPSPLALEQPSPPM